MLHRLRLLLTALVVGTAIFVMHVELVGAAPETHQAMAGAESADHQEHCDGDCHEQHQSHLLMACSMTLIVLGLALVHRRFWRMAVGRWPAVVPTAAAEARAPTIVAFARPPDLAALAVMRC